MRRLVVAACAATLIALALPSTGLAKHHYHYGVSAGAVRTQPKTVRVVIWLKDRIYGDLQKLGLKHMPKKVRLHVAGRTFRFELLSYAIPEFAFCYQATVSKRPKSGSKGTVTFTNAYGHYRIGVTIGK
jgi:hypothetical protein